MGAIEVASLFGVLELKDDATGTLRNFDSGLDTIAGKLKGFGSGVTQMGVALAKITGPLVALGVVSVNSALDFEESMANIGAVLGKPLNQLGELGTQIREIGADSRYGPEQAAQAFYDIVGGVADASTHMAIFKAAVHTAQAGNADLMGTTSALISVMNSYGLSADKAGYASDIMTQIVAKGVGTMSEFASALPDVTGTAAQAGVSFTEVGAAAAYLSTEGFSASESTTRVRQAIVALLNPNKKMADALKAAGYASGSAALKSDGLARAYHKIQAALGGSLDDLSAATGSVWALQGALAVGSDDFTGFAESFGASADGITDAAEAIQMSSRAAKIDVLRSEFEALKIVIGDAILPILDEVVPQIKNVVMVIADWISANPELVTSIVEIAAGVAGLAAAMITVGSVISSIATIVGVVGAVLGSSLLLPIAGVVAAVVGLALAFSTNFLGIRDIAMSVINPIIDTVKSFVGMLQRGFTIGDSLKVALLNLLPPDAAASVGDFVNKVQIALEGIWTAVQPSLQSIVNWFTGNGENSFGGAVVKVVSFVNLNIIAPLQQVWDTVRPFLQQITDWFTGSGENSFGGAVVKVWTWVNDNVILPLEGIWDTVRPYLQNIADWFTGTGENSFGGAVAAVIGFVNDNIVNPLKGIWDAVRPALEDLKNGMATIFNWINTNVLNPIATTIANIQRAIDALNSNATAAGPHYNDGSMSGGGTNVGFHALGGRVLAGETSVVGENGPELVTFGANGYVTPNHQVGGNTYQITVMMPETALVSSQVARQRGQEFGAALMEKVRARG